MPPNIVRNYQEEIIETITDLTRHNKWFSAAVNLGGVSGPGGGSGGPVGGFFGLLPQTKVAYDTSESEYLGIQTNSPSGSLVDNLAHMRYRLGILEASGVGGAGGSGVQAEDEGTLLGTAQTLDFVGAGVTASILGTEVTVTIPGATDTDEKTKVSSNDTAADYLENKLQAGSNITLAVINEGANETIEIASTASGSGADEKVKVSSNDTTEDYLENKVVAGNNVQVTVLNEGANEQLQITSTASGGGGGGGSGVLLRDEGSDLGVVSTIDIVGADVVATASGTVGTITVLDSTDGHIIQDEGISLTQRSKLNFEGTGVTVTDDAGNDATLVTIASGVGGGGGFDVYNASGVLVKSNPERLYFGPGDTITPVVSGNYVQILARQDPIFISAYDFEEAQTGTGGSLAIVGPSNELAWGVWRLPDSTFSYIRNTTVIPADWDGETFKVHLYWARNGGAGGDWNFGLGLMARNVGEGMGSSGTDVSHNANLTVPGTSNLLQVYTVDLGTDVDAGYWTPGDLLTINIRRNGTAAGDTATASVDIYGVKIEFGRPILA